MQAVSDTATYDLYQGIALVMPLESGHSQTAPAAAFHVTAQPQKRTHIVVFAARLKACPDTNRFSQSDRRG